MFTHRKTPSSEVKPGKYLHAVHLEVKPENCLHCHTVRDPSSEVKPGICLHTVTDPSREVKPGICLQTLQTPSSEVKPG